MIIDDRQMIDINIIYIIYKINSITQVWNIYIQNFQNKKSKFKFTSTGFLLCLFYTTSVFPFFSTKNPGCQKHRNDRNWMTPPNYLFIPHHTYNSLRITVAILMPLQAVVIIKRFKMFFHIASPFVQFLILYILRSYCHCTIYYHPFNAHLVLVL